METAAGAPLEAGASARKTADSASPGGIGAVIEGPSERLGRFLVEVGGFWRITCADRPARARPFARRRRSGRWGLSAWAPNYGILRMLERANMRRYRTIDAYQHAVPGSR